MNTHSEDERRRHPYSEELSRSVWDLKEKTHLTAQGNQITDDDTFIFS
jgi:hypothetical protein